jgi:hypothetical protein
VLLYNFLEALCARGYISPSGAKSIDECLAGKVSFFLFV